MPRNSLSPKAVHKGRTHVGPPQAGQLISVPRRAGNGDGKGLRERKKARMRQQIIDASIRLFRERGYENTRIDDIVGTLEISQPTFFRYFPTKDAVLRDVGLIGFASAKERLEEELSRDISTAERLHEKYQIHAQKLEKDQALWRAVVLSGVMDPVRSPEVRQADEIASNLLEELLRDGQKRGDVTRAFPVSHLAEFLQGLSITVIRRWAVDFPRPHSLSERLHSAVEFFLRAAQP